ncbi:MAG TPA: hypothetical protein VFA50_15075 [Stellaceae bacterium]|nr:hypothetical protein [Stellaceae bacterium]
MSYRRHTVSKAARKAHKRREKKRKAAFGGLAAFAYGSLIGVSKKRLSARMGRLG